MFYSRTWEFTHLVQVKLYTYWTVTPYFFNLQVPGNHHAIIVPMSLTILATSHKWSHAHLSFCDWPFWLSIMSSRLIHFVAFGTIPLFFLRLNNISLSLLPGGSDGKVSACDAGDPGLIPGLGRSPGEGKGNPLQYSCLENSMDGGAW